MIGLAFLAFMLFFATLGFLHALEEVEVGGRRYRAAPVFPALILLLPLALMLAFMVPGLGALTAAALEPRAFAVHIQQAENSTAVVVRSGAPPAVVVQEPALDWLYWVYVLAAGLGPLAAYYAAYNTAAWLEGAGMVPLLVRIPLATIVVEEEVVRREPVEVAARRRRTAGEDVVLPADWWLQ